MNAEPPSIGPFPTESQAAPRGLNRATLGFLRWLAEHGRLTDNLERELLPDGD
jgi:hypothetical protein